MLGTEGADGAATPVARAAGGGPAPSFGVVLREARLAAGLTQEVLAERAGVSARALQDLERGGARPQRETLRRLAEALALPTARRSAFEAAGTPAPRRRAAHGESSAHGAVDDRRRHNLPLQLTSFVGREAELADLARRLTSARLLTLTGPGGAGKTRLALRAAEAALSGFAGGVWFVALDALADPAMVPQAVAQAVGVREEPNRPLLATLVDALSARRVLLVLDNCEHLLDAAARLADAVLRGCPRATVLATSREALGVAGETVWPVPSLDVPEAPADAPPLPAEESARSEAVRLFLDRAVAVQPGFRMTDQNAPAVAAICRRLDGIPLAIELAAVRVRALAVEQVLDRLEDRFRLLTGGSRTGLERHQTLQAAVDWSYDLLPAPEQALFRRLAVFAGRFTLEAAEHVGAAAGAAPDDVLDLLTHLVDKSLVVLDPAPAGGGGYRLLETLRQYALHKLAAAGEAGPLRQRHAEYYLRLAEATEPALWGAEQVAGFERLEAELGNLRAALTWSGTHDRPQALRLATALGRLWLVRGLQEEGRRWLHDLLRSEETDAAPAGAAALRARALTWAARLAWRGGRLTAARALAEESIALHRGLGEAADPRWHAWALTVRGTVAYFEGRLDEAATMLQGARSFARRHGQEDVVTSVLFTQGHIAREHGDYATAQQVYTQVLTRWRRREDATGIANALLLLGGTALRLGDLDAAAARLQEALAAARAVGGREGVGACLEALGQVAEARGDPETARVRYAESLSLFRDLGMWTRVTAVLVALAGLALDAGETGDARRHLRETIDDLQANTAEEIRLLRSAAVLPFPRWHRLPRVLLTLACLAAAESQPERALRLAGAAEALDPSWRRAVSGRPAAERQDPLVGRSDRWLAVARAALDKPAQEAAQTAGRESPLEQTVADALASLAPPSGAERTELDA